MTEIGERERDSPLGKFHSGRVRPIRSAFRGGPGTVFFLLLSRSKFTARFLAETSFSSANTELALHSHRTVICRTALLPFPFAPPAPSSSITSRHNRRCLPESSVMRRTYGNSASAQRSLLFSLCSPDVPLVHRGVTRENRSRMIADPREIISAT